MSSIEEDRRSERSVRARERQADALAAIAAALDRLAEQDRRPVVNVSVSEGGTS